MLNRIRQSLSGSWKVKRRSRPIEQLSLSQTIEWHLPGSSLHLQKPPSHNQDTEQSQPTTQVPTCSEARKTDHQLLEIPIRTLIEELSHSSVTRVCIVRHEWPPITTLLPTNRSSKTIELKTTQLFSKRSWSKSNKNLMIDDTKIRNRFSQLFNLLGHHASSTCKDHPVLRHVWIRTCHSHLGQTLPDSSKISEVTIFRDHLQCKRSTRQALYQWATYSIDERLRVARLEQGEE